MKNVLKDIFEAFKTKRNGYNEKLYKNLMYYKNEIKDDIVNFIVRYSDDTDLHKRCFKVIKVTNEIREYIFEKKMVGKRKEYCDKLIMELTKHYKFYKNKNIEEYYLFFDHIIDRLKNITSDEELKEIYIRNSMNPIHIFRTVVVGLFKGTVAAVSKICKGISKVFNFFKKNE